MNAKEVVVQLRFRWLAPLAVAVVATGAVTATFFAASAESSVAAPDGQPAVVEDFSYPGAAQIFADHGVQLTSGDGHIVFADCATPQGPGVGLLQVRTTEMIGENGEGFLCFQVLAPTGYLNLLVPAVYEIRGDGTTSGSGHKVRAELTTDAGARSTVEVNPSGSTPVGIGAQPGNPPTTLLRLEAHF